MGEIGEMEKMGEMGRMEKNTNAFQSRSSPSSQHPTPNT
jgi:hypothetical protein